MMNEVEMPVRQAAVIYLKNLVTQNWNDREGELGELYYFSLFNIFNLVLYMKQFWRDFISDFLVAL